MHNFAGLYRVGMIDITIVIRLEGQPKAPSLATVVCFITPIVPILKIATEARKIILKTGANFITHYMTKFEKNKFTNTRLLNNQCLCQNCTISF